VKMMTWLTSILRKSALTRRVCCLLRSVPETSPGMIFPPDGASSGSFPGEPIEPARLMLLVFAGPPTVARLESFALVLTALFLFAPSLRAIPSDQSVDAPYLPDAPEPQSLVSTPVLQPDPGRQETSACDPATSLPLTPHVDPEIVSLAPPPCTTCRFNWYQRFIKGPQQKPLTPREKAWLAARNFVDPFNLVAIAGEAGISVAANSHSPYGPGMPGYGRDVGVSITEDMTGEFFGTFLIPSLAHQDPRYYRLEHAPIHRRIEHAIVQVFWTTGDNGKGMPNYANLGGLAFDEAIDDLYVPGRATNLGATANRYAIDLASAPIGNFDEEFLPDVASHIHVQIALIQRIINQVAQTQPGGRP